ncbi:PREDICTED: RUS1 family protein C16orf58 homolog [Rhagoletis zephyria]|uniref:RUS1 family protein C16orf58 homolog n=1 Tax=Rhagoletis zephyria TaxID=28612 RepID=UPI00081155DC|nr:PREDICTED: RUS1 family protein C16orf58 homolog [Rhagoletis zephyria]XP_036327714.1 RUS family member 1 [Rhagoletis pomonella]
MKVHFREQYGTKGEEVLYITPADQSNIVRVPLRSDKLVIQEKIFLFRLLQNIFLPKGYPDSVSDDYAAYQVWDTIQAFCSTICGTLCTHAILKGIGVGNENISAYSATVTWILKEGSGHLGRILFSWWKGSQLDVDSKKWRLRADFLNDLAMCIEIYVLPKYAHLSTQLLCGTTVMKAIVGVAGGATRAALTQHHAIRGNLADVASKDSSQETFVNLIASFIGLYLLTVIKSQSVLYSVFIFVIILHLYANLKAVKAVCLRTFNESRYLIALEEYFRSGRMLTPQQVNKMERVTIGQTVSVSLNILIGLSIKTLIDEYRKTHAIENIISSFDPHERFIIAENNKNIGVYLHFDTRSQDVLKAYFFAVSYLQDRNQIKDKYWEIQTKWQEFVALAQKEGWLTTQHLLMVDEYRLDWKA